MTKKSEFCAVWLVLIVRTSIIRATLFDLLHIIEAKNGGGYFSDDNERNFTQYSNSNPFGVSRKINGNTQDSSFFVPNLSADDSTTFLQDSSNTLAIYQYAYPKPNPFDEFLHKIKKNTNFFRPKAKPISPKYFAHRATTTGLDVNLPFANGFVDKFKDRIKTIYPGTLWCGGGDIAKGTNELGLFAATDNCCKMHDLCPLYIEARSQMHGLKNGGLFTRTHCDCDREFYYCLKRINTFISNKIGYTYFNILGPQCFREEYPVVTCAKRYRNRCYSYLVDDEDSKTWQWFDNKFY
ncbi:uncharacterized protein LOC132262418 [Phlebotomus argentipes]|uniref:uncharacterized protein LOC132262418 n=1 Tax=Phlebotomus argentipes TaxID=94469 RepID=UPI002892D2C5|nr:uncharacterized protein LOC132262418 [Phlebotomus argentipes]